MTMITRRRMARASMGTSGKAEAQPHPGSSHSPAWGPQGGPRRGTAMVPTPRLTLCMACRHLRLTSSGRLVCDAFPGGIPRPLRDGEANHRYPYPGDRGFRFEPAPDVPRAVLAELEAFD